MYKKGRSDIVNKVAASLVNNATQKNNVLAQMFFLKCNGWSESQPEHQKPIININYSQANERDITEKRAEIVQDLNSSDYGEGERPPNPGSTNPDTPL